MQCPECRGDALVVRIVSGDSWLTCLACAYTNGPLPAADTSDDMAFV